MKNLLRIAAWSILLCAAFFTDGGAGKAAAKEFLDVPPAHPNYAAIREMQRKGYLNGYPDGNFWPDDVISRKHAAQLLDRALKLPKAKRHLIYKDVPPAHPYYQPIMNLTKAGIVSGDGKMFYPEEFITKIQLAKMIDTGFGLYINPDKMWMDDFSTDISPYHWGFVHLLALRSNGIEQAAGSYFHSAEPVTRAYFAEVLSRALKAKRSPLNEGEIGEGAARDITLRLVLQMGGVEAAGKESGKKFSQIRPLLLNYTTERFADVQVKKAYTDQFDDSFERLLIVYAPAVRFRTIQPDANTVKVHTISRSLEDERSGGYFLTYTLKKEKAKWKFHDISYAETGKKHFELTADEAQVILKREFSENSERYVRVRYVSEKQAAGTDKKTKEKYTFKKYTFIAEVDGEYHTVILNSNNGSYTVDW